MKFVIYTTSGKNFKTEAVEKFSEERYPNFYKIIDIDNLEQLLNIIETEGCSLIIGKALFDAEYFIEIYDDYRE